MIVSSKKFIKWQGELPVSLVELRVSSASELPEADEDGIVMADGTVIAEGSIARVIQEGNFYELDANGDWYCEGEKYAPTPPNNGLQNSPPLLFGNFTPEPDEEVNYDEFLGNSESE